MLFFNFSYFLLLRFFLFCIFFILILFFLCSIFAPYITTKNKSVLTKNYILNKNKKSAYECGFEPFNDSRGSFEVHFHITAIMFLLFDIEVAYLLP
jgi:NADH-quinone oxidoreductase subunit A